MRFCDIPGQVKVKQRLIQSVKENRVSHAQLFLGPEGSGKLALALAYAQYINCKNRSEVDSCGSCSSCNKFSKLIHPDLHFLYPINKTKEVTDTKVYSRDFIVPWREFVLENKAFVALPDWYDKIGIEKKQGLINADDADTLNITLAYKAYEAEYKVMIIWMPEKMNGPAANKLLKNLEEPPDKTLFILISENADQVISTILSRTQLIKVPALETEEVRQFLVENYNLPTGQAANIALVADGNLANAISKVQNEIAGLQEVDPEKEKFILLRDWMRKVYVFAVKMREYDQLQQVVTRLIGDGSREKQKEFLAFTLGILRQCMIYNVGNQQMVKQTGEELEFISRFSSFVHPGNIAGFDEEINKAILHIERNANAVFVFTDLSLTMARLIKIPAPNHAKKV